MKYNWLEAVARLHEVLQSENGGAKEQKTPGQALSGVMEDIVKYKEKAEFKAQWQWLQED